MQFIPIPMGLLIPTTISKFDIPLFAIVFLRMELKIGAGTRLAPTQVVSHVFARLYLQNFKVQGTESE